MISSVVLVVVLLLPGMDEPRVQRYPMESFEACMAKVQEAGEGLKAHEGEAYRYLVGCEITGTKTDPA
jgi:hypothetical protein